MTQVILFSGWEDIKLIKSLINEGASGLISKHESINEVRDAIRAIKDKKLYASKSMQSAFQKDVYPFLEINAITLRLKEVLYLISHELSNKQISDCLQITPKTVEYHRAKLFKALGIKNTVGLGVYAVRSKIYYDPFLKKIYSKWLIKK